MLDDDVEAKAKAWAIERYKKRFGDDPGETKCKYPFCDDSGHPAMSGYCSCKCESQDSDYVEIKELKTEIERLRRYIQVHKNSNWYQVETNTISPDNKLLWSVLDAK